MSSNLVNEKPVSSFETCSLMAKLEGKQQRQLIREKLRSRPSSRSGSSERTHNKGPMLARPLSPARNFYTSEKTGSESSQPKVKAPTTTSSSGSSGRTSPAPKSSSRGSSPVGSPKMGRAPSPRRSRASSPTVTNRRGQSPQRQSFLELAEHVLQKRVQKALHARLFLLKNGPNSFLVGGDSPEHKFKVTIGEQNCNCNNGPFCIHLLFVMLRVFKVEENDPLLWSRTLKDFEVEELFQKYEMRKQRSLKHTQESSESPSKGGGGDAREGFLRIKKESIASNDDDEMVCPICLLAMVEGESLVTCKTGCLNNLHHHCMARWAKECEFLNERLVCPLCRIEWHELLEKRATKPKQRKFVEKLKNRGQRFQSRPHQCDPESEGNPTAAANGIINDEPVLGRVLRDVNDPELAQLTLERNKGKNTCDRGTETRESDLCYPSNRNVDINLKKDKRLANNTLKNCSILSHGGKDEAEAVACALEISLTEKPLPFVPGLMPSEADDDTIVCVQVQPKDEKINSTEVDNRREYQENFQWVKGEHLGTGAFSTCYQAWDRATGTIMAVKQISFMRNSVAEQEKVAASITKEIELMASLSHPNVVRLLGATRQGCHFNMFLEWMPAGSVSNVLELYGAFEEPLILKYTRQVLRGLVYLHKRGVIHRDLKGANLLLDSTGHHIRIADLGTAAKMSSQFTGTEEFKGQVLGTIAFMAPEVLRGETYGRSCDVWSLGCCIFEMATGEPPWEASKVSNSLQLIFRIASAKSPPDLPEHLSSELKDLILGCLQALPSARPTSNDLLHHSVFNVG